MDNAMIFLLVLMLLCAEIHVAWTDVPRRWPDVVLSSGLLVLWDSVVSFLCGGG